MRTKNNKHNLKTKKAHQVNTKNIRDKKDHNLTLSDNQNLKKSAPKKNQVL
jgi:hypothetical protein